MRGRIRTPVAAAALAGRRRPTAAAAITSIIPLRRIIAFHACMIAPRASSIQCTSEPTLMWTPPSPSPPPEAKESAEAET